MAIQLDDHLARVLGETKYNNRHDIWLWLHLTSNGVQFPPEEINNPGMRNKMANFISASPQIIEQIKRRRNEQLLPEKNLEWINEGKRQAEWLNTKIPEHIGYSGFIPPPGLLGKELLIARIDLWNVDITQKKLVLNELEKRWNEHKKGDNPFKWFKDEQQKCILAWEWISRNAFPETLLRQPFDNYEDLLIFFDQSKLIQDQKILYIEKIKRSWSQQKYREKMTGKQQYNFILSDKAISQLDKIAETNDLKRTQVLELLLQLETEMEARIPERLKRLRYM
ncbi:hypothetical protein [Pseudomonas veronii]